MNYDDFCAKCSAANVPLLTLPQFAELAQLDQFKTIDVNDIDQLKLVVRAMSDFVRKVCADTRIAYDAKNSLRLATTVGMAFFRELARLQTDRAACYQFLLELKFIPQRAPYYSFHVYGGVTALCFSEATSLQGIATINIDACQRIGEQYNWKDKITIQLSATELLELDAVLHRRQDRCVFLAHGQQRDKFGEFAWQDNQLSCKIGKKNSFAAKNTLAVPHLNLLSQLISNQVKAVAS